MFFLFFLLVLLWFDMVSIAKSKKTLSFFAYILSANVSKTTNSQFFVLLLLWYQTKPWVFVYFSWYWLMACMQRQKPKNSSFFLHLKPNKTKKIGKTTKTIFWVKTKHSPSSFVFLVFWFPISVGNFEVTGRCMAFSSAYPHKLCPRTSHDLACSCNCCGQADVVFIVTAWVSAQLMLKDKSGYSLPCIYHSFISMLVISSQVKRCGLAHGNAEGTLDQHLGNLFQRYSLTVLPLLVFHILAAFPFTVSPLLVCFHGNCRISSSNLLCCSHWSSTSSTLLWRASLSAQHAEACDEVSEPISMASAQKRQGKSQHEEASCGEILQVCALCTQPRCAEAIPERKGALWHFCPVSHCFSPAAPSSGSWPRMECCQLGLVKRVLTVALGRLDACITSRRRAFGSTSAGVASARDASNRMTSIFFSSMALGTAIYRTWQTSRNALLCSCRCPNHCTPFILDINHKPMNAFTTTWNVFAHNMCARSKRTSNVVLIKRGLMWKLMR